MSKLTTQTFTPGPWVVNPMKNEDGLWEFWIDPANIINRVPAKCFNPYDANLVSAAPDLYEVAEMAKKILEEDDFLVSEYGVGLSEDRAIALELAKKALAKARGERHG